MSQDSEKHAPITVGVWTTTKIFAFRATLTFTLVFIAILILAFFSSSTNSKDVAQQLLGQFQSGECSTMYQNASTFFTNSTSEEKWGDYCRQVGLGLTGEPTLESSNLTKDEAGLRISSSIFRVKGNDGVYYDVFIELVDQDGWKLGTLAPQPSTNQQD